jgi:hypothetical protein
MTYLRFILTCYGICTKDTGVVSSDTIRYAEFQSGLTAESLTALCTAACFDSITAFRSKVLQCCANDVYTDVSSKDNSYIYGTGAKDDIYNVERISIKPFGLVDPFFVNYNVTCTQDKCVFCHLMSLYTSLTINSVPTPLPFATFPLSIVLPMRLKTTHVGTAV